MNNNIFFLKYSKEFTIDKLFEANDVLEFNHQFIIIENFYKTPELVRNYAIDSFDYSIKYPYGSRSSIVYYNEYIFNKLNYYINVFGKSIINDFISSVNGSFLYLTKKINRNSWIHIDQEHDWAGVIYMNNLENPTFGTKFFIEYNQYSKNIVLHNENLNDSYYCNENKFITCDTIGNKFNKLVIYRSNIYHGITKPFGINKNDCRITQTFFLDNID